MKSTLRVILLLVLPVLSLAVPTLVAGFRSEHLRRHLPGEWRIDYHHKEAKRLQISASGFATVSRGYRKSRTRTFRVTDGNHVLILGPGLPPGGVTARVDINSAGDKMTLNFYEGTIGEPPVERYIRVS